MDEDDIVTEFRRFEEAPESEKPRIVDEQVKLKMPSPDAVDPELLPDSNEFWGWFSAVSLMKEADAGDQAAADFLHDLKTKRWPIDKRH
jgi:hypothetical protein